MASTRSDAEIIWLSIRRTSGAIARWSPIETQGARNDGSHIGIVQKRQQHVHAARISQVTEEVRGIVAIGSNLSRHGRVSAGNALRDRSGRSVRKHRDDRLEAPRISEFAEDQCGVAAQMPVVKGEARFQFGDDGTIAAPGQLVA